MSVRSIIAVASGKGGVGKSTTAVNLAVSLQKQGARVGLVDADLHGPNIPMMMGVKEELSNVTETGELIPFESHGVKMVSVGFLLEPGRALIWRGPKMHMLIQQFLKKTAWGELDFLIVDLPPGTGDASISLTQTVPLTGAVVVTTPQAVALSDVRRSVAMLQEVKVPILGFVENMSGFYCEELGKVVPMFKGEGGTVLAKEYGAPLLGQIPFDPRVGDGGDRGVPISISHPDSVQGKAFSQLATRLMQQVKANETLSVPQIEIA